MIGIGAPDSKVESQPKVPRVTSRDSTEPVGDPMAGDGLEARILWKQINLF